MQLVALLKSKKVTSEQLFMLSVLAVNAGNYLYNLILGRMLGPAVFADAAVLITFLLVMSFAAMTFQLVAAKFSVILEHQLLNNFVSKIYQNTFIIGLLFGCIIMVFSSTLQSIFNTSSSTMFIVFGCGVPIYFLMSVNRGVFQGKRRFRSLSITYQTEMLSRLLVTLALLFLLSTTSPIIVVAIGILASFVFGLMPFNFGNISLKRQILPHTHKKAIRSFFIITAFYELTQIVINNSDILLVKHYFESYEAGLYASLALIGRIVYFITWMFVMLLLPTVVQLKKEGRQTAPILFKMGANITKESARKLISMTINFIIRKILGMNFKDTQCGAKIFK
ncbi:hypothetical protein MHTCC0001_07860 [Flavobacteriaceae bacterium MHTCC 0001]